MLLDKVRETVSRNALLKNGDTVICAVSGGADSICLLHVMRALKKEYNLSVYVANVNHLIRGEEAERDSNFVKSVCKMADVECFYREYDVPRIAKEKKIGEEECGRILRYEFFSEISQKLGGAKIATAHNLNDNAETFLFRLIRGSSMRGLSGIKYKRDNIIRPLLDVPRDEIEDYLIKNGISWCEDSTNKIPLYARNKLRLSVMPLLREVFSGAEQRIVSAAKLISEDNLYLDSIASKVLEDCFFGEYFLHQNISSLPKPISGRVLIHILELWKAKEVSYDKVEKFLEFLAKESGKKFDINKDYYAEKSYDKVCLVSRESRKEFYITLSGEGTYFDKGRKITVKYCDLPVKKTNNRVAVFDAEKISPPFTVRYRRDGDKMIPSGMTGTKKISDILSDEKVEKHLRDSIPLILKDDTILFLCGCRQSALFAADENTKKYIVFEYEGSTNDNR